MTIEIDYLRAKYQSDALRLGAKIYNVPYDSDLIRVEFKDCRAYVRDQYVKIRDQNHNVMILDKFDFSTMTIF